jgi:hypothetical protein
MIPLVEDYFDVWAEPSEEAQFCRADFSLRIIIGVGKGPFLGMFTLGPLSEVAPNPDLYLLSQ